MQHVEYIFGAIGKQKQKQKQKEGGWCVERKCQQID